MAWDFHDEIALLKAKNGDEASLLELYRHFNGFAFSLALGVTQNWADSEDAVTLGFSRLFGHLNQIANLKDFRSYLGVAVKNVCLDIQNGKKGKLLCEDPDMFEIEEKPTALEEEKQALYALIALTLTDEERTIFLYRVEEELTFKEIAKRLGLSINAVTGLYSRAKQKLRGVKEIKEAAKENGIAVKEGKTHGK